MPGCCRHAAASSSIGSATTSAPSELSSNRDRRAPLQEITKNTGFGPTLYLLFATLEGAQAFYFYRERIIMNTARVLRYFLIRLLPVVGLVVSDAMAQNDPPGRVGRLNHAEGAVTFSPSGDNEWTDAELNRPL